MNTDKWNPRTGCDMSEATSREHVKGCKGRSLRWDRHTGYRFSVECAGTLPVYVRNRLVRNVGGNA